MAFGATNEKAKQAAARGEETKMDFEWPWIPLNGGHNKELKGGIRKIRLLPELDEHGELVLVPAVDRAGKVIKNKMVSVTATETRFTEIWWKFMLDGKEVMRRIFVSSDNPWDNPFWNDVAKPTEKGSPERKAMKQRFAINVVDRTPVLFDPDGNPVYADENGVYRLSATGKIIDVATGTPEPLNRIRILEQTAGQPGGRHFFQQLINLIGTVEDGDGNVRDLHEFDVTVKITGADINTTRAANPTANFKPLTDDLVYAPRYDLATWAKPWPNDAIEELLSGRDFNEVLTDYNLAVYPVLKPVRAEVPFDESVPAETPKRSRNKKQDEELFD